MPESQAAINYIQDLTSYIQDLTSYNARVSGGKNCLYLSGATTSSAITGSTKTTSNTFGKLLFLTSGTLTSITSTQITNSTDWSSADTIASGTAIYIKFTKVKTKTGKFLCCYY
jgi:hypothetical protein